MAPMSEDEHNVEHILYVTSDKALQAKHRADDAMKDNDFVQSIAELTVCIEELAIDSDAFGALKHAAAFLTNTRAFNFLRLGQYDDAYADGLKCIEIDVEGGAWHRVIRAAEERLPIEQVLLEEAKAEEERIAREKEEKVVPEARDRFFFQPASTIFPAANSRPAKKKKKGTRGAGASRSSRSTRTSASRRRRPPRRTLRGARGAARTSATPRRSARPRSTRGRTRCGARTRSCGATARSARSRCAASRKRWRTRARRRAWTRRGAAAGTAW